MNQQELQGLQEAYLSVYSKLDEKYVPLRTADKPYDSEGNPTDTQKWSQKKGGAESKVGRYKNFARHNIGDPHQNLSKGIAASRRLEAMRKVDQEPESQRKARATERASNNRRRGKLRSKLQTAFDRSHLERSFRLEKVDIYNSDLIENFYDIILSHLLDEGYAETPEAAEVIMVNMSEEWRESIVEEMTNTHPFKIGTNRPPSAPVLPPPTGGSRRPKPTSSIPKLPPKGTPIGVGWGP